MSDIGSSKTGSDGTATFAVNDSAPSCTAVRSGAIFAVTPVSGTFTTATENSDLLVITCGVYSTSVLLNPF